jgi:YD repeat-containing protein
MIRKKILLVLVSLVVVACALPCLGDTVTYEYDDLYRLIKAIYSDGTVIEYTYDEAGNRLSVTVTPATENGFADPINWHDYVPVSSWSRFWISDFNADGMADIMYLSTTPYKYMVMLSIGSGFSDPVNWHDYEALTSFNYFWINDYNGDGKADIMYLSTTPYKYMVMLSTGSGFSDPVNWHDYETISSWTRFWVNDYNGDGMADIMYLSTTPYKYMVMLSNGSGFEDGVNWHDYEAIYSFNYLWVSDYDGDGKQDIMYLSTTPFKYMVMLSTGSGFSDPVNWHDYEALTSFNYFWINDYNGDGKQDIMYWSQYPYKYMVMLSTGSGFEDGVNWHDYEALTSFNYFWINDYNGDGKADIMYLSTAPYKYMVMLSN